MGENVAETGVIGQLFLLLDYGNGKSFVYCCSESRLICSSVDGCVANEVLPLY